MFFACCALFVSLSACSGNSGADPELDASSDTMDATEVVDTGDSSTDADLSETGRTCETCDSSNDCISGHCAELTADTTVCLEECASAEPGCEGGFECVDIDADLSLCVPEQRSCEDPCLGVTCDDGQTCDESGDCIATKSACEPCESDDECGGEGDFCLSFGEESSGGRCAVACGNGASCEPGYECIDVDDDESSGQCVPIARDCESACLGVSCESDEYCEESTGACVTRADTCESCSHSNECASGSLCVSLPGPECTSDEQCTLGGGSCVEGECRQSHCLPACELDSECTEGSACTTVGEEQQACVPRSLSCVDRCATLDCAPGTVCDPILGECITRDFGYCSTACTLDARCGFDLDGCGTLSDGNAYCLPGCDPPDIICPDGYSCQQAGDGRRLCFPDSSGLCEACDDVSCDSGSVCSPRSSFCEPRPTSCTDVADCEAGERCAIEAGRCVPGEESCTDGEGFCSDGTTCFSSVLDGTGGHCLIRCEDPFNCTADAGTCAAFEPVDGAVCVRNGLDDTTNCAIPRPLGSASTAPCDSDEDCEGQESCVLPTGDNRGFCAISCQTAQCPSGQTCEATPEGEVCVPRECGCFAPPTTGEETRYLLDLSLQSRSLNRCDFYRSEEDLKTIATATSASSAAMIPAIAGRAMTDPLGASQAWLERLGLLKAEPTLDDNTYAFERVAKVIAGFHAEIGTLPVDPVYDVSEAPTPEVEIREIVELIGIPNQDFSEVDVSSIGELNETNREALRKFLYAFRRANRTAFESLLPFYFGTTNFITDSDLGALLDRRATAIPPASLDRFVNRWLPQYALSAANLINESTRSFLDEIDETDPALATLDLRIEGPDGVVIISGTADDTHIETKKVVLSIDYGGDDIYSGSFGAHTDPTSGRISVAVDLSGADRWTYAEALDQEPTGDNRDSTSGLLIDDGSGRDEDERSRSIILRQGAAIGGIGQLYDLGAGDDQFETLRAGQGFAVLGVGLLVDAAGESLYSIESAGLGAGFLGLGAAVVSRDSSVASVEADALGSALGHGVGIYSAGPNDDEYVRNGEVALYSDEEAFHALLGAGVGGEVFADNGGIAGGVGVFFEPGGADQYPEARLSLGAGHYGGAGAFIDLDGNDQFSRVSSGLGYGAEFGLGVFANSRGTESFGSAGEPVTDALGSSKTGGTAVAFQSDESNDYLAGERALGASVDGGFSLFVETAGSDIYQVLSDSTLGHAEAVDVLDSVPPTFAVFLDGQGNEIWNGADINADEVDDNVIWNRCNEPVPEQFICIGSDRTRGPIESVLP